MYTLLHHRYRKHASKVVQKPGRETLACLQLQWQALGISQLVRLHADLVSHLPLHPPDAKVAGLFRR